MQVLSSVPKNRLIHPYEIGRMPHVPAYRPRACILWGTICTRTAVGRLSPRYIATLAKPFALPLRNSGCRSTGG